MSYSDGCTSLSLCRTYLPVKREFFLPKFVLHKCLLSGCYLFVGVLFIIIGFLLYNIKCLEVAVVAIWSYINKTELNLCEFEQML